MQPRPRFGFTLIELLIVVVIIGVLASFAIPKYRSSKGKAYAAAMRSDLRNFSTAQESYAYEHGRYASDEMQLNFNRSPGVSVDVREATQSGWYAVAIHPRAWPITCAMYIGSVATATAPAEFEGIPGCQ